MINHTVVISGLIGIYKDNCKTHFKNEIYKQVFNFLNKLD